MELKTVKVTSKGQISLPVDIRKSTGIKENDELVLIQKDGLIILEKVEKTIDRFGDLLKHSESVAKKLWDNEEDKVWDEL